MRYTLEEKIAMGIAAVFVLAVFGMYFSFPHP